VDAPIPSYSSDGKVIGLETDSVVGGIVWSGIEVADVAGSLLDHPSSALDKHTPNGMGESIPAREV